MAQSRKTHRSFVSYIDKSREFYAAQAYDQPYQWAAHDDAPFAKLSKPLSECKIGLVTTSYFLPGDFEYRVPSDLPRVPALADRSELDSLDNQYLSWAKDETHTDDLGSFLPLAQADRLVTEGRIGAVSDKVYCLPTQYSHRQTQRRDTPQLIEWMKDDGVDVAVMIPL